MTHFLDIDDHAPDWLRHVLTVGRHLRENRRTSGADETILAGRTLAMLFEKPSLRTRVSFEQAMYELGGRAIHLSQQEVGLGKRESAADVARVLGGMVDGLMARVFSHASLEELAEHSPVPVVNALSDASHPCQALADVMTIQDEFGEDPDGISVAFIGDGNNVAVSLARLCARLGMKFVIASPPGYELPEHHLARTRQQHPGFTFHQLHDPAEAVGGADVIYTDTFVSMGQEAEKEKRVEAFRDYQLDQALLDHAPLHAIVLHCLPAYRGIEITDEVMDGPRSRVFPQAHNRLHAQKGLLAVLLGDA